MVREYLGADGTFHGFIWENGRVTALDLPGAAATSAAGINARGAVIGSHLDAAGVRLRGFLLSNERCASFDAPGAQLTVPLGINRISGGSLSAEAPPGDNSVAALGLDDPARLVGGQETTT